MYIIEDSYGAPQAGYDVIEFDDWHEVEEYLDENPDVAERIEDGYAIIKEAGATRRRNGRANRRLAARKMRKAAGFDELHEQFGYTIEDYMADLGFRKDGLDEYTDGYAVVYMKQPGKPYAGWRAGVPSTGEQADFDDIDAALDWLDSIGVPTYRASRKATAHHKVALMGDDDLVYELAEQAVTLVRDGICDTIDEAIDETIAWLDSIQTQAWDVARGMRVGLRRKRAQSIGDNWRGNPVIRMRYYNEWSDPDLLYKDYVFNYWDVENAMWDEFLEHGGDPDDEAWFDKYVQEFAVDYLEDCIFGGYFQDDSKTWHR